MPLETGLVRHASTSRSSASSSHHQGLADAGRLLRFDRSGAGQKRARRFASGLLTFKLTLGLCAALPYAPAMRKRAVNSTKRSVDDRSQQKREEIVASTRWPAVLLKHLVEELDLLSFARHPERQLRGHDLGRFHNTVKA
jgi:hypothetical protein